MKAARTCWTSWQAGAGSLARRQAGPAIAAIASSAVAAAGSAGSSGRRQDARRGPRWKGGHGAASLPSRRRSPVAAALSSSCGGCGWAVVPGNDAPADTRGCEITTLSCHKCH